MKIFALALLALGIAGALALPATTGSAGPGVTVAPLLSCPNVDGSMENGTGGIRVGDVLAVVQAYHRDWPALNYHFLFDLVDPYNPDTGTGGIQRVNDILNVVQHYHDTCPLADTQVAQATLWAIQNVPVVDTGTVPNSLASLGYIQGSSDVPGQGKHYLNILNWIDPFNPAAPEGLVYDNSRAQEDGFPIGSCSDNVDNGGDGKGDTHGTFTPGLILVLPPDPDCDYFTLAAQLYVVLGDLVGWIEDYNPGPGGSCHDFVDNGGGDAVDAADPDCQQLDPSGQPLDDINIDPLCNTSSCSWSGDEGWHLHYRLCTYHAGTKFSVALAMAPGSTESDCAAIHNSTPCPPAQDANCPGFSFFQYKLGWMGHLWDHLPNPNRVPDVGADNGRFADCYTDRFVNPSTGTSDAWTAYNCPQ